MRRGSRAVFGATLMLMAAAAPAAAQSGVSGCPWAEFTRLPGASTFPESNTQVYQCAYSVGPSHETVLRGRPPAGRFWSFAVLDQARREVDSITDAATALEPDGSYRIVIRDGCGERPNCLDVSGAPAPELPGLIFYRIYVPEQDGHGGVPLPLVSYESPDGPAVELAAAEQAAALSDEFETLTAPLAPGGALYERLATSTGLEPAVAEPGAAPVAERYHGLGQKQVDNLAEAGVPAPAIDLLRTVLGQGGFGATADNAYVTVGFDMRKGDLVLSGKAPTYRGQSATPANDLARRDGTEQVRYWSLCTTQATRTVDCARDETVPVDAAGRFEVIVAPACPVAGYATCLRAGALGVAGPGAAGTLLYRNTLAAPGFLNEDGPATCPDGETMYCGDYALTSRYVARP